MSPAATSCGSSTATWTNASPSLPRTRTKSSAGEPPLQKATGAGREIPGAPCSLSIQKWRRVEREGGKEVRREILEVLSWDWSCALFHNRVVLILLSACLFCRVVNYEGGAVCSQARSLWRLEPLRIRQASTLGCFLWLRNSSCLAWSASPPACCKAFRGT